jgi:hypothetical protein
MLILMLNNKKQADLLALIEYNKAFVLKCLNKNLRFWAD